MNILLSRILTYLNGTLFHDYNYKICTFIIFHYLEMEDMSEEEILDINDHIEDFLYGTKISRFMSVLDIKKIKKIGFVNSDLSYIYDEFLQACYLVLDDDMPGQKKARKLGIFLLEEFERSGHWLNTGSYYTLLKELLKKEGR